MGRHEATTAVFLVEILVLLLNSESMCPCNFAKN